MSTATATKPRFKPRDSSSTEPKRDPYQVVTDAIVAALEKGTKPWEKSWTEGQGTSLWPLRANGQRYRGINTLVLLSKAIDAGYNSPYWMTYQQAQELGGQVRKGERSTAVVFYGTSRKNEPEATETEGRNVIPFLKTYAVFNSEQVDNLPERYTLPAPQIIPASERIAELDQVFADYGVQIVHGGNRAYYQPSADRIHMPEFTAFHTAEQYYSTLSHEAIHSTKAKHRLDRDFGAKSWGDEAYAMEELVAELGAAMLGSIFNFPSYHVEEHAAYLAHWIGVLKSDKRAIFTVAAKAQAAADLVLGAHKPTDQPEGE